MSIGVAPLAAEPKVRRPRWLKRADLWFYATMAVCIFADGLLGPYGSDGDSIAYLDISDLIHAHAWHSVVNAYWSPLYPALLLAGKAVFGYRLRYELLASKLVDSLIQILFVFASVFLASSLRRLMRARGFSAAELLPRRTLYVCTAVLAYFLAILDLVAIKPDALLAAFFLLMLGFLVRGIADNGSRSFALAGLFGGFAMWTKAFAFPFFLLCMLCLALAHLRNGRILRRLGLTVLVFAVVSGPWIWLLSQSKGRFTYGDSGTLNMAWYINRADRFNPVQDLSVYRHGRAIPNFKHPGQILSKTPDVRYFDPHITPGSFPQWDNPSYWSDGLKPRFVPRQFLSQFLLDTKLFLHTIPLRLQVLFFAALLPLFGFSLRKRAVADSTLIALLAISAGAIASYLLVHFEQRFVVTCEITIFTVYAVCSLGSSQSAESRYLKKSVLLFAALVLLYGFQNSLRELKAEQANRSDDPLHGIYDLQAITTGARLASLYPAGTQVACMGDDSCDGDWARYGRLSLAAYIDQGNGMYEYKSPAVGCAGLEQHPEVLDILRHHHIRAVIARFGTNTPCSSQWQPLNKTYGYYYLPL